MDPSLIASFSLLAVLATVWTVTKVAVGLGFVIFVHELGHFLAAKACGVKCEKFYVGFDIPIKIGSFQISSLGKFTWGETEYGIGILPLGGYVKMLGQDDNPMNAEKEAERIRVAAEEEGEEVSQPDGTIDLDPRSFPAKPVWQRLIIISAGVIMNLIFGVVFAAVAYKMGVPHKSCDIAGTAPGDPAWIVGLEPGDKIIQIGKDTEKDENMRFDMELREKVYLACVGGTARPMDILIRRNGVEKWYTITPSFRARKIRGNSGSLGVVPPASTMIAKKMPAIPATPAAEVEGLGGHRVIEVNGVQLPRDPETKEIFRFHVRRHLLDNIDKPVQLTLEEIDPPKDQTAKISQVTIQPKPLKMIGLVMKSGPIVAIRNGTPAQAAGFELGDILSKVDGKPIGNPMTLDQRLQKKRGTEATFTVLRDGMPVDLKAKIGKLSVSADYYSYGAPAALTSIGVAFDVKPVVAEVVGGSVAEQAGIQSGDIIKSFNFALSDDMAGDTRDFAKRFVSKKPTAIGGENSSWPHIHSLMQTMLPGMQLELTFDRNGTTKTVQVQPAAVEGLFDSERGIRFTDFERIHVATSWGEASRLGLRETKEKLQSVVKVLGLLVTGKISVTNLGGPVLIAYVAGSEANRGISRLLLFLTMLSANLAVLNFLPIPALDGGHAVFLVWEGVTGKPANERIQGTLTLIGVALLLCLMLFVLFMDIGRLLPR